MLKDQDIREPLFDFFDEKFGKVRIIEEKQIAKSRADVMLVLGSSHSKHIEEHVPEYWGIIEAISKEESVEFNVLREPEINKRAQRTYKMKRKLSILWRPELSHIQEINGMPKYKQRSKDFVITKIMEKVPWDLLHRQISEELFQRDYNTISEAIKEWRSSNKH